MLEELIEGGGVEPPPLDFLPPSLFLKDTNLF